MFHDRRLGRRAIWAVVIILGVVIGAYSTVQMAATSGEPVAQAASNTGSVIWRVEGWAVLLSQWASSPLNWFTGEPFGTSFLRRVEGSEVVGSPHDFYIEILLRTGALGLLALLALTVGLLVATWRRSAEDAGVFGSGACGFAHDAADLVYNLGTGNRTRNRDRNCDIAGGTPNHVSTRCNCRPVWRKVNAGDWCLTSSPDLRLT
jgi:O-antigen ligase